MGQKRFHISLYILVPAIFAGLVLIASIVAAFLATYSTKYGARTEWPIVVWGTVIGMLSYLCALFIMRLILGPVESFAEKARAFVAPIQAEHGAEAAAPPQGDEIQRLTAVFEQVTEALSKVDARQLFPAIIVESRSMRGVLSQVMKVAPTESTVLILGESGTGKELVASSIWEHSRRKDKPFIKLNCVAIPEDLLESELFGHEKGAFTGAIQRKPGKFELADGGTLFLDEIGDMPMSLQGKMLRVLQEKEFDRVGGVRPVKVDVRIIAATNKNLEEMVKEGLFREDLFYRLNVFTLHLPPLRARRREDIPILVNHFIRKSKTGVRIAPEALQSLMHYNWPGNVRELQNTIERATVMAEKGMISLASLPARIRDAGKEGEAESGGLPIRAGKRETGFEIDGSLDDYLAEMEKAMIVKALGVCGGVQVRAAKLLGIKERSLWNRVKKYGIDVSSIRGGMSIEGLPPGSKEEPEDAVSSGREYF